MLRCLLVGAKARYMSRLAAVGLFVQFASKLLFFIEPTRNCFANVHSGFWIRSTIFNRVALSAIVLPNISPVSRRSPVVLVRRSIPGVYPGCKQRWLNGKLHCTCVRATYLATPDYLRGGRVLLRGVVRATDSTVGRLSRLLHQGHQMAVQPRAPAADLVVTQWLFEAMHT